ncbi:MULTISPECIES: hypothetical protein [Streptomyces]|uniref:hypothetical protein n=1 Tax=Streptomyces TaxID=1883 RepID=UPI0020C6365A|nr:hypothetical protein [Streptomyces sp. GbtcB7]
MTTNPTSTAYDNRHVDVTGSVTKADGTPAPNIPVTIQEVVRFTTWNPWGDPIDPNYYEPSRVTWASRSPTQAGSSPSPTSASTT